MKKITLGLVLALLLSGCATSQSASNKYSESDPREFERTGQIYVGMKKNEFCWLRPNLLYGTFCYKFNRNQKPTDYYFREGNFEVLGTELGRYYVYKNVTIPIVNAAKAGNGILESMHNSMDEAKNYIKGHKKREEKTIISEKIKEKKDKEVKLISMINEAKKSCKILGFKEGTEKFSDCSLKLYTQKIELIGQKNQTVIIPQSPMSNTVTIYDPVRDSDALIKRGQGLLNGNCTLADLSNC